MAEFSGTPSGAGRRIAVVVSRFNESVTQKLVDGALDALTRHDTPFDDIDIVWVPGAWELPAAARLLLSSERYNALVALGAVIRGETPHFDFVAGEAARGLAQACADFDTPVGFGLLTCDTTEQAEALWLRVVHRPGQRRCSVLAVESDNVAVAPGSAGGRALGNTLTPN